MDEQADDDRHGVHGQLAPDHAHVLHLDYFACNQEEDAQGGVPVRRTRDSRESDCQQARLQKGPRRRESGTEF